MVNYRWIYHQKFQKTFTANSPVPRRICVSFDYGCWYSYAVVEHAYARHRSKLRAGRSLLEMTVVSCLLLVTPLGRTGYYCEGKLTCLCLQSLFEMYDIPYRLIVFLFGLIVTNIEYTKTGSRSRTNWRWEFRYIWTHKIIVVCHPCVY